MQLRITDVRLALADCSTRFPFRYGMVTLRRAPQLTARVVIEGDSGTAEGFSADLLAPKWFEKDADKTLEDDFTNLAESTRLAAAAWRNQPTGTLFDQWWSVYRDRVLAVPFEAPDRLVRGFGVALVERAVMDAACRAAGLPFHAALQQDLFGVRPAQVHPDLDGWSLPDSLPAAPLTSVQVRHTVGLLDPLHSDEVPDELATDDGLPVALDEDIARYGIEVFKVKVAGTDDAARERLRAVAAVTRAEAGDTARFTLDGNEQIEDLAAFLELLEGLRDDADGAWLLERLLWIEQPLHRSHSFDPARCAALSALNEVAPVILDEADAGTESFPRGVALGYRGVSVKNCKGVLRALMVRGLTERLGDGLFQTSEDLTNLGVLSLQQDLATLSSLGLPHSERNGHHYFRGLTHLPAADRAQALEAHPALYEAHGDEVRVAVRGGRMDLSDVVTAVGYGHATTPDMRARTQLEDWSA